MTEPARQHRLNGLEPDNLLAFLALLGLLHALETARPDWRPRASWDFENAPLRPILMLVEKQDEEAISQAVAEGAMRLAEDYDFPAEAPAAGSQTNLNYSKEYARRLLEQAIVENGQERAGLWASLMSDAAVKDGRIEPTPLCLLFGQGHQHFLDRLSIVPGTEAPPRRGRGKTAIQLTAAETIHEALFQPWSRQDPTPAFRWDPAEDVRYALRAGDPSGDKATTQHGANRLAALGLPTLVVTPRRRGGRVRLQLLGASVAREIALFWPIWREPASLSAIRALLTHPMLSQGPDGLAHLGVGQVRCARRISVGKFMNFTRADVVGAT
jgi:hypothetical protein